LQKAHHVVVYMVSGCAIGFPPPQCPTYMFVRIAS
jgi:hypothetical protein